MAKIPIDVPDNPFPGPTVIPVIRPILIPVIQPMPNTASTRCPSCGIDFAGTVGYVCQSTACPTQPKIICTTRVT